MSEVANLQVKQKVLGALETLVSVIEAEAVKTDIPVSELWQWAFEQVTFQAGEAEVEETTEGEEEGEEDEEGGEDEEEVAISVAVPPYTKVTLDRRTQCCDSACRGSIEEAEEAFALAGPSGKTLYACTEECAKATLAHRRVLVRAQA